MARLRGVTSDGINPELQLWVNGNPVSGTVAFTAAIDPSGYQTYTFTFTNPNQTSACGCGESVELKPADLAALAAQRQAAPAA